MKRLLLVIIITGLLALGVGSAIPVFAHGSPESESTLPEQDGWQAMYEACEEGDWDAMAEAAETIQEEYGSLPCQDEYTDESGGSPDGWNGMMDGYAGSQGGMMG